MSSEKFCLKWNDFEANISGAFKELRDDKDFFDVTLACDDDQINAHKVILSACSPFFRNILRRNPHQHPLLYMKGVSFANLQSVLNFMYHGEVNVAQDDLNNFLSVAEDLRVKGLTQGNQGGSSSSSRQVKSQPEPTKPRTQEREIKKPVINRPTEDDDIQEVVSVKSEPPPSQQEYQDPAGQAGQLQQYEAEIQYEEGYEDYGQYDTVGVVMDGAQGHDASKDAIQSPEDFEKYMMRNEDGSTKCTLCHYNAKTKSIASLHIESIHFPGLFSYNCQYCGQVANTKKSLRIHINRYHKMK